MKKVVLKNGDTLNLHLDIELRNVHYKYISFVVDELNDAIKVLVNCFIEEKGDKV